MLPEPPRSAGICRSVPLSPHTTLGVGGPAELFCAIDDERHLLEVVAWADGHGVPLHVLGGGSNVLVADAGVPGLVVQIALRGVEAQHDGDGVTLTAAAGEVWDEVVHHAVSRQWAGIECLSGIPGRVGATPIQNVGAYGQDVAETLVAVRAYDRRERRLVTLGAADCGFGYRDSLFKSREPGRFLVLAVTFRLRPGGAPTVRYPELRRHLESREAERATVADVRRAVLEIRWSKSMVIDPADPNRRSCGSFFLNPLLTPAELEAVERRVADPQMPRYVQGDGRVKLSAAWLIERAGFTRGARAGAVGLSTRHTLAVVCHDGARADDVIRFARRVRNGVEDRFGVRLIPEPVFWGLPPP